MAVRGGVALALAVRLLARAGRHPGHELVLIAIQVYGLVFKAHRYVYHSTLGLRVIKKKKRTPPDCHSGFSPESRIDRVSKSIHLNNFWYKSSILNQYKITKNE